MQYYHTPVLTKEVIDYLDIKSNKNYIDATLGLGGHAEEILKKNGPHGKLLAIEQTEDGLDEAKNRLSKYSKRIIFVNDNFRNFEKIIKSNNFPLVSGILFDLGLASWQIGDDNIGLSFSSNHYLDMRLDPMAKRTASEILTTYTFKELSNMFYEYGDIRSSRHLAEKIIASRKDHPIKDVRDLTKIIGSNNPKILAPVFQALRIEVNNELSNLNAVLPQALSAVSSGGRIVVISYHSGEDRIVKNFFRANKESEKILTKKPIVPSWEEIKLNSRSRSAKLRAAEKI